jgi:hypothetical protein
MRSAGWIPVGVTPSPGREALKERQKRVFDIAARLERQAQQNKPLDKFDGTAVVRALRKITRGAPPEEVFDVVPNRKEHRGQFFRSLPSAVQRRCVTRGKAYTRRKPPKSPGVPLSSPLIVRLSAIWKLADEIELDIKHQRQSRQIVVDYITASLKQIACGKKGDWAFGIQSRRGQRRTLLSAQIRTDLLIGWIATYIEADEVTGIKPTVDQALDVLVASLGGIINRSTLRKHWNSSAANRASAFTLASE